jgi:integrase
MARTIQQLTSAFVDKVAEAGDYLDGDGLYLRVSPSGSKSWVFIYKLSGRRREMGLGTYPTVTLIDVREKAGHARKLKADGIDPIQARKETQAAQRAEEQLAALKAKTFRQYTEEEYLPIHKAKWHAKTLKKQLGYLKNYIYPVLGEVPIREVDTKLVLEVIKPIWATKSDTAGRVRSFIKEILASAKIEKLRTGENPATWGENLEYVLPSISEVHTVKHREALSFEEMGKFWVKLQQKEGITARALEFTILTALRTSEVLWTPWDEIEPALTTRVWTIPVERMKPVKGKEEQEPHDVPLTDAMIAVLERMAEIRQGYYVFPGLKKGKPLTDMAMLMLLRRMTGYKKLTTHGFRSTFRDWAGECTEFQDSLVEFALAHQVGNAVARAYRRRKGLEKRRRLMKAWADFCNTPVFVHPYAEEFEEAAE